MQQDSQVQLATRLLLESTFETQRDVSMKLLARALRIGLGVRYGLVAELVRAPRAAVRPGEPAVRIRAIDGSSSALDTAIYPTAGSVWERVPEAGIYHVPSAVRAQFPEDELLRFLQAESFLGVTLKDTSGTPIGVLAAVDDSETQPISDLEGTLQLFGARASAELEMVHAEEELARSERRYRRLVTTCQEGIWWLDAEGKTTYANPSMAAMLGYSVDEMVGMPLFHVLHPSERTRGIDQMVALWEGRPRARDLRLRARNGEQVLVSYTASAVRDPADRFDGVLAIVTDTRDRLALEERVLQSQKLQSVGLLAGGIAHDFNNVLLGILGRAELGQTYLAARHPAAEALRGIATSVEHAAHLTSQLLAYAGKRQVRPKLVDLGGVASAMAELLRSLIARSIKFDLRRSAPAEVFADPTQVTQVVMNLIVNAGDAIGNKAGLIAIDSGTFYADRELLTTMSVGEDLAEGTYAYLTVRDTGCGMDAATQRSIFEPFFSTKSTGRGLGLAAVLGIVRSHHGALKVESRPGEGSTFTVLLPAANEEDRRISSTAPPPPVATAPRRGLVIVADDEEIARDICRSVLEAAGFEVRLASNVEQAMELFLAHQQEVSALVLDQSMLKISGEAFWARVLQARPDLPVVISSGDEEMPMAEVFHDRARGVFLSKPWRGVDLLEALDSVLAEPVPQAEA